MNRANAITTFKCEAIEGDDFQEVTQNYEELVNKHIHEPECIYHDGVQTYVYMRPQEYSLVKMGKGEYAAHITLIGTLQEPINSKKKHE